MRKSWRKGLKCFKTLFEFNFQLEDVSFCAIDDVKTLHYAHSVDGTKETDEMMTILFRILLLEKDIIFPCSYRTYIFTACL